MKKLFLLLSFACIAMLRMQAQTSSTDFGVGSKLTYTTDNIAAAFFDGSTSMNFFEVSLSDPSYEDLEYAVKFSVDHPVSVKGYRIFPSDYMDYVPKSWALLGSNDKGTTWDIIDKRVDDATMTTDLHVYHSFALAAPTTKKYDSFALATSASWYEGQWTPMWQIFEFELDYVRCDAFGHKDELVHHAKQDATCNKCGYTQDCYECINCGGFFTDANGYRKIGKNPIILPKRHDFSQNKCKNCGFESKVLSGINTQGVNITFEGNGEASWEPFAAGDKHGKGIHTTKEFYYSAVKDDEGNPTGEYEYGDYGSSTITMQSDLPFTVSFKASLSPTENNSEVYGMGQCQVSNGQFIDYIRMEKENDDNTYCITDISKVIATTYSFGPGEHWIDFSANGGEAVQLNLWDFKIAVDCNHIGYEHELVQKYAANCVTPTRTIYLCKNCNEEFEELSGSVDATKHEHLIHGTQGKAATCTDYGFATSCWLCEDCGNSFLDEACTQETLAKPTISPLEHAYVNNVCTRCGSLKDHRISHFILKGVTAYIEQPEGAEGDFGCKGAGVEGDYTFVDNFGLTRTFPANALVSTGVGIDMSRANIYLESEQPFSLTFKLNYSIKSSDRYSYGKSMQVFIDDGEESFKTDNGYFGEAKDTTYYGTFSAGRHKLTLQYGREFYEGSAGSGSDGDDFGYIFDFAACNHEGTIVSNTYFKGDCVSPSLTQRTCTNCEWCDTIKGELDPLVHPHDLAKVTGVNTCMTKGVNNNYYFCADCSQRFSDALGTKPVEGDPLGDVIAHSWGADGKCTNCGQNHYYDGTPVEPKQVTLANCEVYGLGAEYVGYYAITTPAELYGFAQLVNTPKRIYAEQKAADPEYEMDDEDNEMNAVLLADIVVNPSVLDGQALKADTTGLHKWEKIGGRLANDTWKSIYPNGVFDGRFHTISGLYRPNKSELGPDRQVGLFAIHYGTIRNLNIDDSYFSGLRWVGALTGDLGYSGTVENCHVKAVVETPLEKTIDDYTPGAVGIIAGKLDGGVITNCLVEGSVKGYTSLGGIAGEVDGYSWNENKGNITNCLADVTLESECTDQGSIVGLLYRDSNIDNCYYIQHGEDRGIGNNSYSEFKNALPIEEKYVLSGELAYNLHAGSRFAINDYNHNYSFVYPGTHWGQLIGTDLRPTLSENPSLIYRGYEACEKENLIFSNRPVTTENNGHRYDDNGICHNTDGEVHYLSCPVDEDGTYLIGNYGHLYSFMAQVNAGNTALNARLTDDITVNDKPNAAVSDSLFWTPIGQLVDSNGKAYGYSGKFDGGNHTIQGLCVKEKLTSDVGLFGRLEDKAVVQNVVLKNCEFGGFEDIGAIAGDVRENATISCCTILDCNVYSFDEKTTYYGGIVGSLRGNVESSFTNNTRLLGFKKDGAGEVKNSYSLATGTKAGEDTFLAGELASGSLCYRLNGGASDENVKWRQTLGKDAYPLLSDSSKIVYYGVDDCTNMTSLTYSNFEVWKDRAEHKYVDGLCERCHEYEPAVLKDGWYEISNSGQLYWAAQTATANSDADHPYLFKLCKDIEINSHVLKADSTLNEGTFREWTPIGTVDKPFYGIIDGQGHEIKGIYCVGQNNVAFVASIAGREMQSNETVADYNGIRNLKISDSYFHATENNKTNDAFVATFAAQASGNVRFWNLTAESRVTAPNAYTAGGIVGKMDAGSRVDSCAYYGYVDAYGYAGGMAGWMEGASTITYSRNYGKIAIDMKNGECAGGIVGYAIKTQVSLTSVHENAVVGCSNLGPVTGYQRIGGVIGKSMYWNGTFASINVGEVSGIKSVAGIVGNASNATASNPCGIYYCYNLGNLVLLAAKGSTNDIASGTGIKKIGCASKSEYSTQLANLQTVKARKARRMAAEVVDEDVMDVCLQQVGSGELCYFLNVSYGSPIFRQQIGVDPYPVLAGPQVYRHKTKGTYKNFVEGDMNDDGVVDVKDVEFTSKVLIGEETDYYDVTIQPGEKETSILSVAKLIELLKPSNK